MTVNPSVWIVIEVLGTLSFALSGLLEGGRRGMDAVGLFTVSFVAAFGGGTLRDLLLDRRPFFWVDHPGYLALLLVLVVVVPLLLRKQHWTERLILLPDALGLGLFCAIGTAKSLDAGMPMFPAVLLGVLTATFGGVLRDVLCNQLPSLFRDHRPYAVCAFCGAWVQVALLAWGWDAALALVLGFAVTTGLRLIALWRNWRLPQLSVQEDQ